MQWAQGFRGLDNFPNRTAGKWLGPSQLTVRVGVVVVLMAVTFYLHGRYLVERPANRALIVVATLADLTVLGAGVLLSGGFQSQLFVLLYPVVFAFSLVFPARLTAVVTSLAIVAYAGAVVAAGTGWTSDVQLDKLLGVRLLALAATARLGTYYWRVQRRRRREALSVMGSR